MREGIERDPIHERQLADAAAARRNQRALDRFPLFTNAGIHLDRHDWTADDIIAQQRAWLSGQEANRIHFELRARGLQCLAFATLDEDEFADLDAYQLRTYPPYPWYRADFWRQVLKGWRPKWRPLVGNGNV